MKDSPEPVKRALDLKNASYEEISRQRKMVIFERFGVHEDDTGSPSIQAAILCEKTVNLMNHIRGN